MILTNLRLCLRQEVIHGTIIVENGQIVGLDSGISRAADAQDCDGDYLLPGLIELHTDNLEKHFSPRPGVIWPALAAVLSHDAQMAGSGITTVLDALALGDVREGSERVRSLKTMADAILAARADDLTRAEHFLHLRCEISYPDLMDLVEQLATPDVVKLVSIMDHTPGQRQFTDLGNYRNFYKKKFSLSDAEMQAFEAETMARQARYAAPQRAAVVATAQRLGLPLASHDDAKPEHVAEAAAEGMRIAEFPTTLEAADLSRKAGMKLLMGAPNLVRGGSHSGNIAAADLAARGWLDILSSDYMPVSLLQAVFLLAPTEAELPAAAATATATPAEAVGLHDRGRLEIGKRADLLRVRLHRSADAPPLPIVQGVWRAGRRVA
jgi:alpha-D-ribose 1-methylphosphonate 5-triphosphate diphosphatase